MPKKKKKLSKRQDGKRLNEEGRLSPLEIFQRRMEYYNSLADDELAKGELASRERIGEFLNCAQSAAVKLAPYRHPRLQATTVAHSTTSDLEKLLREIEVLDDGLFATRGKQNARARRARTTRHRLAEDPTLMRVKFTAAQFADRAWRLNNLFYIVDKNGRRIKFQFNWAQEQLYKNLHDHNVILKARQLGVSTFVSLFMLDQCLFKSHIRAGTVAHDLASSKGLFRDKIKYPFENLPEQLRIARMPLNDSSDELLLSNNSSLRIATSMRSGTMNLLHVSEFGKICARFPDRAREVVAGSLNTLAAGAVSFIESTAEGQEGRFYEMCSLAQTKQRLGINLSNMESRFHFFPWTCDPTYVAEPDFDIPQGYLEYFAKLELTHGIKLTAPQKAWYVAKGETQFEDMKREFPTTPDEAFEASVEGTYYGPQIAKAEMEQRIGYFPADRRYAVNTCWDIGVGDATAIWFWQFIAETGRLRFLHYYECSGEGAEHYVRKTREIAAAHHWPAYGYHFLPHDVAVHEWGTNKTRIDQLIALGIRPSRVPLHAIDDGINGVRMHFKNCDFDESGCAEGLKALRAYRRSGMKNAGDGKTNRGTIGPHMPPMHSATASWPGGRK